MTRIGSGADDQFDPVAATLLDEVVEQFDGDLADGVLPPADVLGRERPGGQSAQAGVVGSVGVDERSACLERVGFEIPQVRVPDRRREHLGVA